ncbi:transcriptional regulator, TetR family protein [Mycobacterium xenopi 3993]|nr:transcriptional regulator, TetR family protein [Mycobacterium xenopi 3993]
MAQQTKAVRSRRRGEVLENALYDATLAELSAVGYGGLTMEGIAARAAPVKPHCIDAGQQACTCAGRFALRPAAVA